MVHITQIRVFEITGAGKQWKYEVWVRPTGHAIHKMLPDSGFSYPNMADAFLAAQREGQHYFELPEGDYNVDQELAELKKRLVESAPDPNQDK